jgi:hypothetical protein
MALLAISVGLRVASTLLAPKPKLQPVDRGKLDDIRITTMEEGAFKPRDYGRRVRQGGVIRWATETQEYVTQTPGRSGGKGGGGRGAEPATNNFTYKKSFAVLVCDNEIRRVSRIWEDDEVIFNGNGSDYYADFYEAELAELSGTSALSTGTDYSGGRAVSSGIAGAINFTRVRALAAGAHTLTIFYKSSASHNVHLSVNGSVSTETLPSTSGIVGSATFSITLHLGTNIIALSTIGIGASVTFDRIHVRPAGDPAPDPDPVITGVVDEDGDYPADADRPRPRYNLYPEPDGHGTSTGTLTGGGQSPFEFYTGTETQLQSPTIVAVEGDALTPAWRGTSYVVFKDYLLKDGRLGNFTFEVEPLLQDLEEVLTDLFIQDERASASEDVDFSALAGIISEGFIVHTREQLGAWIDQLQLWYGFDVVPVGDKVVAVLRGGSSAFTLTEDDLAAHHEGEQQPKGSIKQTHEDPADAPSAVDVLYLDSAPEKEFHTGGQQAQIQLGDSYDRDTLTFAIVGDPDTATAVGRRYLDQKELEQKPINFTTGPAERHRTPADVCTLALTGATHVCRIVSVQAELQGLVKFRAVPERASLYTQGGTGQLALGRETPAVEYPANTMLVVADCVAVRQEDLGGLVLHAAACPRGQGAWRGYTLNREDANGEQERIGALQKAATIGIIESASNSTSGAGLETTRSFVVKLYSGSLESRTDAEVRSERVNLALYGKGGRWEVLQFLTVEAQSPTFPFVAQYLVTGIYSGIYGTEGNTQNHEDDDYFILVDEGLTSFRVPPSDLNRDVTFTGQTFGQAIADAEVHSSVTLTVEGNSAKPLAPARVDLEDGTGLAPRDAEGSILVAPWPRSNAELTGDEYLVEFLSDDRADVIHSISFREGDLTQACLISKVAGASGKFSNITGGNTFSMSGSGLTGAARALQVIRAAEGNFYEATLRGAGSTLRLGLLASGKDWRVDAPDYYIELSTDGVAALNVNDPSGQIYTEDPSAYATDGRRFRIILRGTRVEFWKDDSHTSILLATSAIAPNYPLIPVITMTTGTSGNGFAEQVMLTTNPMPTTIFTADQQMLYYGSLKEPVEVRIRQHSGVREIGYGPAFEGAI